MDSAGPSEEDLAKYILFNYLDDAAARYLRSASKLIQRKVLSRGGLHDAKNPSAALILRVVEARRDLQAEGHKEALPPPIGTNAHGFAAVGHTDMWRHQPSGPWQGGAHNQKQWWGSGQERHAQQRARQSKPPLLSKAVVPRFAQASASGEDTRGAVGGGPRVLPNPATQPTAAPVVDPKNCEACRCERIGKDDHMWKHTCGRQLTAPRPPPVIDGGVLSSDEDEKVEKSESSADESEPEPEKDGPSSASSQRCGRHPKRRLHHCVRCRKPSCSKCAGERKGSEKTSHGFLCPLCRLTYMDPFAPTAQTQDCQNGVLACTVVSGKDRWKTMKFSKPSSGKEWEKCHVQVRAVALEPTPSGGWGVWGPKWPPALESFVNGQPGFTVPRKQAGHVRREGLHNLTRSARPGQNQVSVTAQWFGENRKKQFLIAIMLVRPLGEKDLIAAHGLTMSKEPDSVIAPMTSGWKWGAPITSRAAGLARVQLLFEEQQKEAADEDGIQVMNAEDLGRRMNLKCPLSGCRIGIAAVGRYCRHLQCFDLDAYVRTSRRCGNFENRWHCPVCSRALRPEDLTLDHYAQHILGSYVWSHQGRQPSDDDAVAFETNGQWKALPPKRMLADSSSDSSGQDSDAEMVSSGGSAPGTPVDPRKAADRSSTRTGYTVTAKPAAEESDVDSAFSEFGEPPDERAARRQWRKAMEDGTTSLAFTDWRAAMLGDPPPSSSAVAKIKASSRTSQAGKSASEKRCSTGGELTDSRRKEKKSKKEKKTTKEGKHSSQKNSKTSKKEKKAKKEKKHHKHRGEASARSIAQGGREQLLECKLAALKKMCRKMGISKKVVDEVDEDDDPKERLIEMILGRKEGEEDAQDLEDAPVGHRAYAAVKRESSSKHPCARIFFQCGDERIHVQASVAMAGSMRNAERICRLCYVRLENGDTKEQVMAYRRELFKKDPPLRGKVMRPKVEEDEAGEDTSADENVDFDTATTNSGRDVALSTSDDANTAALGSVCSLTPADDEAGTEELEDAPEGHVAHDRVKEIHFSDPRRSSVATFNFKLGLEWVRWQVSASMVGGIQNAKRICRLCFMRFERGDTKEQVYDFKQCMLGMSGAKRKTSSSVVARPESSKKWKSEPGADAEPQTSSATAKVKDSDPPTVSASGDGQHGDKEVSSDANREEGFCVATCNVNECDTAAGHLLPAVSAAANVERELQLTGSASLDELRRVQDELRAELAKEMNSGTRAQALPEEPASRAQLGDTELETGHASATAAAISVENPDSVADGEKATDSAFDKPCDDATATSDPSDNGRASVSIAQKDSVSAAAGALEELTLGPAPQPIERPNITAEAHHPEATIDGAAQKPGERPIVCPEADQQVTTDGVAPEPGEPPSSKVEPDQQATTDGLAPNPVVSPSGGSAEADQQAITGDFAPQPVENPSGSAGLDQQAITDETHAVGMCEESTVGLTPTPPEHPNRIAPVEQGTTCDEPSAVGTCGQAIAGPVSEQSENYSGVEVDQEPATNESCVVGKESRSDSD